jgi:hypothetical protein
LLKKRKRELNISLETGSIFHFVLPNKMRKQIRTICTERDIDMARYVRESIRENNKKYYYLIKNIV